MQLIILGVLFVATALAYPIGESEENKSGVPLVIADNIAKSEEPRRDSSESAASSSSSSEDSSEEPKQPTTEAGSDEATRTTEAALPSTPEPKIEGKREEPKLNDPKTIEEPKLEQKLEQPALKKIEEGVPDVVQAAKSQPAIAEEPAPKPELPSQIPAEGASTEKIEKPLALPTLEGKKDDLAPAPSEKKEEKLAITEETPASTPKLDTKLEEKRDPLEKPKRDESAQLDQVKTIEEPKKGDAKIEKPKEENLKKSEEIPEKLPEPSASS